MPGISQPFPNIFDPANLLGDTGASNTKIRYIVCSIMIPLALVAGVARFAIMTRALLCCVVAVQTCSTIVVWLVQGAEEVARG